MTTCQTPNCGEPNTGGWHSPRLTPGWVNVRPVGEPGVWCCSWRCASIHAARLELTSA